MTSKLIEAEDDIAGYEIVDGELSAMNAERYRAFIQEGINSIEQDGGIPHDVVMAELDAMIAKLAKA